jgi:hypothetical protein
MRQRQADGTAQHVLVQQHGAAACHSVQDFHARGSTSIEIHKLVDAMSQPEPDHDRGTRGYVPAHQWPRIGRHGGEQGFVVPQRIPRAFG